MYFSIRKVEFIYFIYKFKIGFLFFFARHSMGTVMTEITKNAFITIYRMLNDRDRRVFAVYFAMEVGEYIRNIFQL
jgi:hypothetical protein